MSNLYNDSVEFSLNLYTASNYCLKLPSQTTVSNYRLKLPSQTTVSRAKAATLDCDVQSQAV
jgi:hypothetical protein